MIQCQRIISVYSRSCGVNINKRKGQAEPSISKWKQYSALGPRLLPLTMSFGHHEGTVSDTLPLRAPYQYVPGMSAEYQNHKSKAGGCFGNLDVAHAAAKMLDRGI